MKTKTNLFSLAAIAAAAALTLSACNNRSEDTAAVGSETSTTNTASTTATPDASTTTTGAAGATTDTTTAAAGTGAAGMSGSPTGATSGDTSTSPTAGTVAGSGSTTVGDAGTASTGSTATGRSNSSTGVSPEGAMNANPSSAGVPSTSSTATQGPLSATDTSFIRTAIAANMYEVEVAKLGSEKATDPAVKSYASMLASQHTQSIDQLRQLAASRNVQLPSSIPSEKQRVIDKLSKASGAEFDKEFVQTVGIKDHQTNISLFEKASKDAKDADVKSFAQNTLPTLKEHLDAAKALPPAAR